MKTKTIQSLIMSIQLCFVLILFTSACAQNNNSSTAKKTLKQVQSDNSSQNDIKEDIHMAIISGNKDVVEQLIKAGTDLNQREQMNGSTPLMTAITFNKPEITQMLINAKPDLTIKNNDGSTALHNASFFCRIDMVKMLLDAGADKTLKNNYGMTSREIVMGDFKDIKPIYEMLILQLKPMGFQLDLKEVEKARPVVAMMLE